MCSIYVYANRDKCYGYTTRQLRQYERETMLKATNGGSFFFIHFESTR